MPGKWWRRRARVTPSATIRASQKIGVANHQGWAGYLRNGTLFVKRIDWKDGATYPDGGVNVETYTAGTFLELETLGPMSRVEPGATIDHQERWFLFRDVKDNPADDGLAAAMTPLLATTK
jgi:hypothetical protein